MNVIRHTDANFAAKLREAAAASSLFDAGIEQRTRAILARRLNCAATTRCWNSRKNSTARNLGPTARRDAGGIVGNASLKADESLRAAVAEAEKNIAELRQKIIAQKLADKNSHGASVGEKFDPFQRVGVYIPGGTAPLVSTALMTITLAKVAGCKEIVVTRRAARMVPSIRAAVRRARGGRDGDLPRRRRAGDCGDGLWHEDDSPRAENFRPGQRLRQSPPNDCSSATSRLICLPGPSELLVLADDTANPKFAAADMLAQAEHGSGHERVWLVTTSAKI
jgi:histidinol dehydrogenase